MARTIVNKHFDSKEIVTREQFHEEDLYAKGEIIIVNDEEPSIYVLDKDGTPKQIIGGQENGGSINPEELEKIREEIKTGDTTVLEEVSDLIENVKVDINTVSSSVSGFTNEINKIKLNIQTNDSNVRQALQDAKENILNQTINEIPLKNNPVLTANNVKIGDNYGVTIIPEDVSDSVQNSETIQIAFKKIENMLFANTLAITASLNDLHRRITNLENMVGDNE